MLENEQDVVVYVRLLRMMPHECLLPPLFPARDEIRNQQHTFTQDWLIEHAESNPSPVLEPSARVPHFPTPTIHSPVISRASSRRMMDGNSNSKREIAAAACSMVSFSNRSRKKVYNPKNSLLSFLRDKRIENEMVILESKGSNTFDPASTLRLAKRSWYNKRNTRHSKKRWII